MVVAESYKIALGLTTLSKNISKLLYQYFSKKSFGPPIGINLDRGLPKNLPSIIDIKRTIPQRCFQPKVSTSMFYATKDLFMAITCFLFFFIIIRSIDNLYFKLPFVVVYWAIQGTIFTAIFVVGHDCGHGSFSNHSLLNDVVGSILHSFLMAPYFMWKLTHRHHHKNTSNLEKDEVFYPVRKSAPGSRNRAVPGFGLGTGWYGYLLFGYGPRPINHFNITNPLFNGHFLGCSLSLISMTFMSLLLYKFYCLFGLMNLFVFYFIPDFVFGSYCVIITFLQHTELNLPWFADDNWNFVKGQLSSVDRHYGSVHNIIHNIGTHQVQ